MCVCIRACVPSPPAHWRPKALQSITKYHNVVQSSTIVIVILIVIAIAITIVIVIVSVIFVGVVHNHMIHSIHSIHNHMRHSIQ